MNRIRAWKCEICGNIYLDGASGFDHNSKVKFSIGEIGDYEHNDLEFEDVCLNCRISLSNLIESFLNSRKTLTQK